MPILQMCMGAQVQIHHQDCCPKPLIALQPWLDTARPQATPSAQVLWETEAQLGMLGWRRRRKVEMERAGQGRGWLMIQLMIPVAHLSGGQSPKAATNGHPWAATQQPRA